jgi:hypothetical protein
MSSFHGYDERGAGLAPLADVKLPMSKAILLIGGLSALCWAVLTSIVMALWAAV